LDSANNLYIANSTGGYVSEWIAASNTLTTLFGNGDPRYLGRDFAGYVSYVCSPGNAANREGPFRWSPLDGSVTQLTSPGSSPENTFHGLAVDAAGDIYYGSSIYTVVKGDGEFICGLNELTANGAPSLIYSEISESEGEGPQAVAVDGSGSLYLSDSIYGTISKFPASGSKSTVSSVVPEAMATDTARNFYFENSGVKEVPFAFVDPTAILAPIAGGSGQLPAVLWINANFLGDFYPTTDQSWITVMGVTNNVVYYSVAPNAGIARSGNIFVFGRATPIQQAGVPFIPPLLTNPIFTTNDAFQFTFTNNQTTNFSVLYTTNLLTPLSNWLLLGAPSNTSPGVFQFTTPATNSPQGFYLIRYP
jgi:hypothetical protein